jgi:hypothetical protein
VVRKRETKRTGGAPRKTADKGGESSTGRVASAGH